MGGQLFTQGGHVRSHKKEDPDIFAERLKRAYYPNYIKPLISLCTDYIFKANAIARDRKEDPFLEDVTRKGDPVNRFMRELALKAIVCGQSFAVVDTPEADPELVRSKLDQERMGIGPYWYIVDRWDVLNWELDLFGNPYWVLMREGAKPVEDPMEFGSRNKEAQRFILWTRDQWQRIEVKSSNGRYGKSEIVAEGPNELGRVPIVCMYGEKIGDWDGESWVNDAALIAIDLLNVCSLRADYMYSVAIEQLVLPGLSQDEIKELLRGNRYVFSQPADAPQGYFLSPTGIGADVLRQQIIDHRDDIHRLLRQRIINTSANADGASGQSKQEDFASTDTALSALADECERVENELHRITALYTDQAENHATYPNEFDTESLDRRWQRLIDSQSIDMPDALRQELLLDVVSEIYSQAEDPQKWAELQKAIEEYYSAKEKSEAGNDNANGGGNMPDEENVMELSYGRRNDGQRQPGNGGNGFNSGIPSAS